MIFDASVDAIINTGRLKKMTRVGSIPFFYFSI